MNDERAIMSSSPAKWARKSAGKSAHDGDRKRMKWLAEEKRPTVTDIARR
jgi:hypothetical protein